LDNRNRQTISNVQTDETGEYFITPPIGKTIIFSVNLLIFIPIKWLLPLAPRNLTALTAAIFPLHSPLKQMLHSRSKKNILFESKSTKVAANKPGRNVDRLVSN